MLIKPWRYLSPGCGEKSFYGNGSSFPLNTNEKMTVVTQFITSDGTDSGDLVEIRRYYVQGGKVMGSPRFQLDGKTFDSVTDDFVAAQKKVFGDPNSFAKQGGLKAMGEAMDNGMVLVMRLWADDEARMLWLDR